MAHIFIRAREFFQCHPSHRIFPSCRQERKRSSRSLEAFRRPSFPTKLPSPVVVYQDNHLLVVNKPPGWHSVPNSGPPSSKCLMTKLQNMGLGGGGTNTFLKSIHRIDQPCSGILIFAKTSKAATRVTNQWKKQMVQKEYLCVVSQDTLNTLLSRAQKKTTKKNCHKWYSLTGYMNALKNTNQRSVAVCASLKETSPLSLKKVSIEFRLFDDQLLTKKDEYVVILVKTNQGSRHLVRATLAGAGGCPIAGDLRYGSEDIILPDRSTALHAYRVHLDPRLQLGTLSTFSFQAPIPQAWSNFFGVYEARNGDTKYCPAKKRSS